MRKTENQTTDTSYHNSPSEASQISQSAAAEQSPEPEKSAKSPYDRIAAARKCAEARTLRRNKAFAAFSLSELLTRLGLQGADGPICASCQGVGTLKLDLDKQTFRCQSCKFKGGKLQLVKKAKTLSDWEAIGFLEKLAAESSPTATSSPTSPLAGEVASSVPVLAGEGDKEQTPEPVTAEFPEPPHPRPLPQGERETVSALPSLVQALKDGVLAATCKTPNSKPLERSPQAAKEENLAVPLQTAKSKDTAESSPVQPQLPTLAASSPVPSVSSRPELPMRKVGEDWEMEIDGRNYRIRGMGKNLAYDTLRVNLRVMWGDKFFMDQVEMSQARQRTGFIHQASQELGVSEDILKREVGKLLLALEELLDRQIKGTLKVEAPKVKMSVEEEQEALSFLRSKDLVKRIVRDFHTCGLVGEEMNSLVGYLSAVSRKLDDPLAMIIQSLSAAGKTALLDAILRFVPPEDVYRHWC